MTLSEKINDYGDYGYNDDGTHFWSSFSDGDILDVENVKEFIKEMKERIENAQYDYANLEHVMKSKVIEIIDELAGERLIEDSE